MEPNKVAAEEARRVAQHERIKEKLEADVHGRIAREAAHESPSEHAALGSVAASLKRKAAEEVLETEADLDRARSLGRLSQVLDYVFLIVYGLIGLEIGLELLGARQASAFKRFLDLLTTPLLAPFKGLMPDPSVGPLQLMLSYVVGLVVYFLLHRAVNALLRLLVQRKSEI